MEYKTFVKRFGASVRTKNLTPPDKLLTTPLGVNKRAHQLPAESEIPKEFIRLDPWEAEYLFIVAQRAKKGIVEIGRFNGGSAFTMACANETAPIYSVDIEPQNDALLCNLFNTTGVGANVTLLVGDSQRQKFPEVRDYDLLFVDGDHSYDGAMRDLENWWDGLAPGGHVVCHDAYAAQPCMDAILDFMFRKDVFVVNAPVKHHYHGFHPAGSMAHFMKKERSPITRVFGLGRS
ncbi:class I SAM-dependent methyltransferase [Hyphococcus sp.]|uniref:class I SAM-dependent methyltransferase n=1 Tax=Hyphococcus sp. TaxID=2038636 RepID=UPI0020892DF1|nr:MAG: hypothetical protein DHS20C04_27730 [Marinicaulis sp.]